MLSESAQQALSDQLREELYSGYLYLAMSAYFESAALPGCARWMRAQAQEELAHAMRFFDFVCDRGGRVRLDALAAPPAEFPSPLAAFEMALEHEQKVTASIHRLYAGAVEQQDYPSQVFLQWFVNEQVEEEKSVSEIVETLRRVGDRGHALVALDRELGKREAD
ncbi:MAG: ferritin [Candidatus Bipolaricaulaceae bacterium]